MATGSDAPPTEGSLGPSLEQCRTASRNLVESLISSETPETSRESRQATIDGVLIPEGVDPSFLEALPEAIRREVLAEQLALRPTPSAPSGASTSTGGETAGALNVSPEFLAALPPGVQDEVS